MDQRGEGVGCWREYHDFPFKIFSRSTNNFHRRPSLVSEKFCYRNFSCIRRGRWGGGYHAFTLKIFCLTVPKNFVGEPFLVSENHDFPLKIFSLTVPKSFVGEPFGISEKFGYRKILCIRGRRGGYCDSSSKIFSVTVPKNFLGESFYVSENFWYWKMIGIRAWVGITMFRGNCFVSQYRIIL